MSMISSQCDELRKTADELDERAKAYAPTGRNVLSPMLRTAADTIWELRCKLAGVVDQRDEIEWLKAENAKLREQLGHLQPIDCEGNVLDIADKVHMLRSEYDGDHEWDDVVVELALAKCGGDRWIVRGSKGEAWACDCERFGYDEDAYENSDNAELVENPTLIEVENERLRELCSALYEFAYDEYPDSAELNFADRIRKLRIEVEHD